MGHPETDTVKTISSQRFIHGVREGSVDISDRYCPDKSLALRLNWYDGKDQIDDSVVTAVVTELKLKNPTATELKQAVTQGAVVTA